MITQLQPLVHFKIKDMQKLHFGENKSYMVFASDKTYVLKCYRENRGFKLTPHDEIKLTQAIVDCGVRTSRYYPFQSGNFIESIDGVQVSLQEMIAGHMILKPDEKYYYQLGHAINTLHTLTQDMTNEFDLPVYDFFTLVEKRWSFVENTTFLSQTDLAKIEDFKNLVKDEIGEKLSNTRAQFIHFDAHTGNLIFNQDMTAFIDWEECGFGHPLLDLAVPCTHLMRDDAREVKLNSLIEGYQRDVNQKDLNYLTMAKFLYSMTHIPTRLDIIKEPDEIFKRYLDYFNLLS